MASHEMFLSGKAAAQWPENSPGLPPPYVLTVRAAIDVSASEVSAPPYGRQLPSEPLAK
jgi:hypothetical protein